MGQSDAIGTNAVDIEREPRLSPVIEDGGTPHQDQPHGVKTKMAEKGGEKPPDTSIMGRGPGRTGSVFFYVILTLSH